MVFTDIAKEILHPRPDLVFGLPRDKTGDAIIDAAISGAQDKANELLNIFYSIKERQILARLISSSDSSTVTFSCSTISSKVRTGLSEGLLKSSPISIM